MRSKIYLYLLVTLVLTISVLIPDSIHSQNTQNNKNTANQSNDLRQIALEFYSNRQFDKAIELLETLYDKETSQTNYTYLLSCYLQTKDYKKAEKIAKNQIKTNRNGNNAQYYCDLGYIYTCFDETKKAEQEFGNAFNNLKPNDGDIYSLANGFIRYGFYDKAIEVYKLGAKIMKYEGRFDNELAYLYDLIGDTKQMIMFYLDYIENDVSKINNIKYRLQNSINKESSNTATLLRDELLKRLQKDQPNVSYVELLLWLSVNQLDFDMAIKQAISLDQRLNENGDRLFNIALTTFSLGNYKQTLTAVNYVLNKIKSPLFINSKKIQLQSRLMLLDIKSKDYTVELDKIRQEYVSVIENYGYTPEMSELISDYAKLEVLKFKNIEKAIKVLEQLIALPSLNSTLKAQYKIELADIYLFTEDVWEASLLYSQVEKTLKNDPIGHEAKFKNAKLTFLKHEFEWAKAQADVLKAATSKLIANDAMQLSLLISDNKDNDSSYVALGYFADAEMLIYQQQYNEAICKLDSIRLIYPRHPIDDDVLFRKYEIAMILQNYEHADTLLATLYQSYPESIYAYKAVFTRALLNNSELKNIEKAKELYLYIVTKQPESIYLIDARNRYRKLVAK